jgi:Fic family protein
MRWSLSDLEEWLLVGSTLVEGSTLSEDEARAVLAGRTVTGHPVREARELLNYRSATEWLLGELAKSPHLSQDLLVDFHRRLLDGLSEDAGRLKRHQKHGLAFRFVARDRLDHLRAVEASDAGDLTPLTEFIRARILVEA